MQPLPIDDKMIKRHIEFTKDEYNDDISVEQTHTELEDRKKKDCLLYDDCRSYPKFGKCCPI